jgi:hypothetical protein
MIRSDSIRQSSKPLEALAWLAGGAGLAWFAVNWILSGGSEYQELTALMVVGAAIAVFALSNWRNGFYVFTLWLVLEDFARKFLGNNMVVYFAKDALVGIVYVAFLSEFRRRSEKAWHPPFLLPLLVFFWWAAMQAFNPASASVSYGLLGLKLYFYYVPLMFLGYALIRTESDLRRFLTFNLVLGSLVSLVGIIQAISGQSFLNPQVFGPDLVSNFDRFAPVSGVVFNRPNSVFVSDGRFGGYLILMWILSFGTIGYFMLREGRVRKVVYLCAALVAAAILLSGVRTAFVYSLMGSVVMVAGVVWGSPFRKQQLLRMLRAIRRFVLLSAAGVLCVALFYPSALASRWAFYSETLSPHGRGSELASRGWEYPVSEFMKTFAFNGWRWGRGLGTASLGTQYVTRLLHAPPPGPSVENGYGQMLLEIGIPGLILWIVLGVALALACWRVVRKLRGTPMFPLAFGIFWFACVVLFPLSFIGLSTYQDFVINAYLWTLIGILFRLPLIAPEHSIQRASLLRP